MIHGFTPIFEPANRIKKYEEVWAGVKRLFLPYCSFVLETEEDARATGWGWSFIEGVLCDLKFTGDVMEVGEDTDTAHVPCEVTTAIGDLRIAVISGELFDKAFAKLQQEMQANEQGQPAETPSE